MSSPIDNRRRDKTYRKRGTTISTVTLLSPSAQAAWQTLYDRHDGSPVKALTEALLRAVDTPGIPLERAALTPQMMEAWNVLWMNGESAELSWCQEQPDGTLKVWSGSVSMLVREGRWWWRKP